ncbi:hypothetical protein ACFY5D_16670 [Paeniglutamicibacter sp. NPDC012692]|uniref:hypothetical protein n=1 Tax=Paeniglutamicibacter sp. NPDC012692 TaxID=3364388 RepID=UPI00368440EA
MEFPDTELALIELLESPDAEAVLRLSADMDQRLPLIHITALPSTAQAEPFLRTDRIQVDVYTNSRSGSKDLSEAIRGRLMGSHLTDEGFLDDIYPEIEPYETPYTSDSIKLVTAIYRVETRPKR